MTDKNYDTHYSVDSTLLNLIILFLLLLKWSKSQIALHNFVCYEVGFFLPILTINMYEHGVYLDKGYFENLVT